MRAASSCCSSRALASTAASRSAGNLTAPFSSIWIISPGATSMPPTLTGTLTACTAIAPWPAQTPVSMYWKPSGRISSRSREGPLEIRPTQPMAFIAETMLPPARPTLPAIAGGNFCCNTRMLGFGAASRASTTSRKLSRAKFGSGSP